MAIKLERLLDYAKSWTSEPEFETVRLDMVWMDGFESNEALIRQDLEIVRHFATRKAANDDD